MENQHLPAEPQPLDNFFNIAFDAAMRAQIKQAALWAKICSITSVAVLDMVLNPYIDL